MTSRLALIRAAAERRRQAAERVEAKMLGVRSVRAPKLPKAPRLPLPRGGRRIPILVLTAEEMREQEERRRKAHNQYRLARMAAGLCYRCGKVPAQGECASCRKAGAKAIAERKARRRALGLCIRCEGAVEDDRRGAARCRKCQDDENKRAALNYRRRMEEKRDKEVRSSNAQS